MSGDKDSAGGHEMSATILTRPTGKGRLLDVGAPSNFIETMRRAFGQFPVVLNETHLEKLRGMAAIQGPLCDPNPYVRLQAEIMDNGEIEVFAEY